MAVSPTPEFDISKTSSDKPDTMAAATDDSKLSAEQIKGITAKIGAQASVCAFPASKAELCSPPCAGRSHHDPDVHEIDLYQCIATTQTRL